VAVWVIQFLVTVGTIAGAAVGAWQAFTILWRTIDPRTDEPPGRRRSDSSERQAGAPGVPRWFNPLSPPMDPPFRAARGGLEWR